MAAHLDLLRGVIERITYHNEETGYTVAKLLPESKPRHLRAWEQEVPIVGNMVGINVGESVELEGRWVVHGEYGKQFAVERLRTVLPATVAGIEKYLGSGLIRGVGPVTAKRIVRHFGADTLAVVDDTPDRLLEVPGVGRKRVELIRTAWHEQQAIKEVMLFLQSQGVSTGLATRIYKQYGDDAIRIVRRNPFQLAQDIFGIGFLTADRIAKAMGIPSDAPQRIGAGVAYVLGQATEEGHAYLPSPELIREAMALLEVSADQVATSLTELWGLDQVKVTGIPGGPVAPLNWAVTGIYPAQEQPSPAATVAEAPVPYPIPPSPVAQELQSGERSVYLTPMYFSEQGVANGLLRLINRGQSRLSGLVAGLDWDRILAGMGQETSLQLAAQQRMAVQAALTHRLTVLTGGPGTGKTTTVRSILHLCDQLECRVLLAAPTGRAAKRLAETTGREAKTIHRLLEFKPSQGMAFKRNEESPLAGDLLIVDEASMLDMVLTNHLLKAVPPGMHLLLVGDVDQLPSVGPGNVLADVIGAIAAEPGDSAAGSEASRRPLAHSAVVRLRTIFRQAAGSCIVTNAHRINQGLMPITDANPMQDFFLFKTDSAERAAQLCVELVQSRIPSRFGLAPGDIQILSPMHRGVVGVAALNETLQSAVNPPHADKAEKRLGSRVYRTGDRVMQVRNNYDKDIYNGDMGVIGRIDPILHKVTVAVDGRSLDYDFLELDEMTHAYAISIHKAQGSEYPAVVIPLLTSHYMMLQRNLLYTGVTRARQLVVLVGQTKAVAMAVKNHTVGRRFTGLRERLLQGNELAHTVTQ